MDRVNPVGRAKYINGLRSYDVARFSLYGARVVFIDQKSALSPPLFPQILDADTTPHAPLRRIGVPNPWNRDLLRQSGEIFLWNVLVFLLEKFSGKILGSLANGTQQPLLNAPQSKDCVIDLLMHQQSTSSVARLIETFSEKRIRQPERPWWGGGSYDQAPNYSVAVFWQALLL
jgi:hypothetical protein